jgi:pimeloyl-ACP methyl ester carboxylesterase
LALDFKLKSLRSFDGTEIAYQLLPDGDGLPIVLANGLGGDYRAWKHIVHHFARRHPVVTWDYRGLYRSGMPATPATLGPPSQARDLEAILDELGWRRVLLVGWSMGVQVNFEAWRRFSSRIAGIAVINGVAGRPFDTALGSRFLKHVIPIVLRQMRRRARIVGRLTGVATGWRGLLPMMQRLGFVGATIDLALFADFARTFSTLDFDLYGATLEALGQHDARELIPSVNVPMSIITGDRDMLTPLPTARALRDAAPHARLVILPGGTHYTPVEFPEQVCAELERLFAAVPREKAEQLA